MPNSPPMTWPRDHGEMAPSLRGKLLVCFYCNKKSSIKYDGLTRQWDCALCQATNYLDETGDITDPPVATDDAAPYDLKYAIPQFESSPSPSQQHNSTLFCATCLKNQHLFTSSLAQYYVETDPSHPDYKEAERKYFAYRKTLERMYPQVCEDCEPVVLERMREAGRTAKTDYLRRLMDTTRNRRSTKSPQKVTVSTVVNGIGNLLWRMGLFGQLSLNIAALASSVSHNIPSTLSSKNSPLFNFIEQVLFITTSDTWARWSLICSFVSVWWNPMFKQVNSGFMRHIRGFSDWYKYQGILLVARILFYSIVGKGVMADHSTPAARTANAFLCGFVTIVTVAARRSLKVDMQPLWNGTPQRLTNVGPKSGSGAKIGNDMLDILDEIANTPSRSQQTRGPSIIDSPTSPVKKSLAVPRKRLRGPGILESDSTKRAPSLSQMSTSEARHYLATGEAPRHARTNVENSDAEEMDWVQTESSIQGQSFTPIQPNQHSSYQQSQNSSATEPAFWYKVPPAPISQAHKLRNPPNQPRLRVSSHETKQNFFDTVTQRKPAPASLGNENASHPRDSRAVEFANPKFFAPQEQDDSALSQLFNSISLSTNEVTEPNRRRVQLRWRYIGQCLLLLLGLLAWKQVYSLPWSRRNTRLLVMGGCLFLGSRNMLDNTVYVVKPDHQVLTHALGAILACFEIIATGYGIVEVLAGRDDCPNCDSFATILVSVMLIHDIWFALFER